MLIKKIKLNHFRCCKNIDVDFSNFTGLIGKNGVGKSSILHAINYFFDPICNVSENDFYGCNLEKSIIIEIIFYQIKDSELPEILKEYISDGEITIFREFSHNSGLFNSQYKIRTKRILDFALIDSNIELINTEKSKKLSVLINSGKYPDFGVVQLRNWPKNLEKIGEYELLHPELCEITPTSIEPFIKKLQDPLKGSTRITYIPAIHKISDETTRSGFLGQIFSNMFSDITSNEEIAELKEQFAGKASKIFSSSKKSQIIELKDEINKILEDFSPQTKINFKIPSFSLPSFSIPPIDISIITDNFESDIETKGSGTQRAILFSLFELKAKIEHREHHGDSALDLIFLIEEPEIYQHPAQCRYLFDKLQELTQNLNPSFNRFQIIYCTHSPFFIDIENYDNIRILRKCLEPSCTFPTTRINHVKYEIFKQKWANLHNNPVKDITKDNLKPKILGKTNPKINEGFFADKIVLVEGVTDVEYFWFLQRRMNKKWNQKNISLLPVYGKTNFDMVYMIFDLFKIPIFLIFDGDAKNKGGDKERNSKIWNRKLLKMLGENEEDFPNTKIMNKGAVFQNELETEIEKHITPEVFNEIRQNIGDKICGTSSKNPYKHRLIIEEIYSRGLNLPLFEEIVKKISEE